MMNENVIISKAPKDSGENHLSIIWSQNDWNQNPPGGPHLSKQTPLMEKSDKNLGQSSSEASVIELGTLTFYPYLSVTSNSLHLLNSFAEADGLLMQVQIGFLCPVGNLARKVQQGQRDSSGACLVAFSSVLV